jgi:hypothetical protein
MSVLSYVNGQVILQREYGYDAAGNRIVRKVVTIPSEKGILGHKSASFQSDTTNTDFYVDKLEEMLLKIYPNPTTSVVTIQVEGVGNEIDGMITLYNLSGAILSSQRTNSYQTEIDLSTYPAGSYLVTVNINDKTTHWKIIKQ